MGSGRRKNGLGSKTDKTEEVAVKKVIAFLEKNLVEIDLACFHATPGSNLTLKQEGQGCFGDLTFKICPTARHRGLQTSFLLKVVLK